MIRGTTPRLTFNLGADFEYEAIAKAELTISQSNKKFVFDCEKGENDIYVDLKEKDTMQLREGYCEMQIRILLDNDSICATKVKRVNVEKLLNEVPLNDY